MVGGKNELVESCDEKDVVLIVDPVTDYEKLANLANTGPNDANIKPVVDELKAKTEADKEWFIHVQRNIVGGEFIERYLYDRIENSS